MVYDVTSADTFVNVKRWLHEIDQNCDDVCRVLGKVPSIPIGFVQKGHQFLEIQGWVVQKLAIFKPGLNKNSSSSSLIKSSCFF